jgi:hypothetical protein
MSIDLSVETVVNLTEACKLLPRGRRGRPVHVSTLVRAIRKRDLRGAKRGKTWFTSAEALQEWVDRQTAASLIGSAAQASRRPLAVQSRSDRRADREAMERGL